jgi:hypothetical protein
MLTVEELECPGGDVFKKKMSETVEVPAGTSSFAIF